MLYLYSLGTCKASKNSKKEKRHLSLWGLVEKVHIFHCFSLPCPSLGLPEVS